MTTTTTRPQQRYRVVMLIVSLISMSCLFWFPNVLRSVQQPTTYFDDKTNQRIERMIILTKSLPSVLLSSSSSSSSSPSNNNNNTYRDHRYNGIMMTGVDDDDDDDTTRTTTTTTGDDDGSVIRPRAWPIVTTPLPCEDPRSEVDGGKNETWWGRPVQKRPPLHGRGLFYLKLTKSASSTAAGVHLRVAHNLLQRRRRERRHHQQQQQSSRLYSSNMTTKNVNTITATTNDDDDAMDWPICRVRFLHGWAGPKMFRYGKRDDRRSFLWTTVRHPTPRAVSEYFHFHVGRRGRPVSFRSWEHFTKRGPHSDHHSLSWLSVRGYRYGTSDPYRTAQRIVREYDFIGVVERLDESFVVLSLLLDVPLRDVLYVSSKVSGTYDDLCVRIPVTNILPAMEEHINGTVWQSYIAPEVALWEAANDSLDLTIKALGESRVATRLRRYRSVMEAIRGNCTNDNVRFPCSANGTRHAETDCFVGDMGCGWDCIDMIADDMGLP